MDKSVLQKIGGKGHLFLSGCLVILWLLQVMGCNSCFVDDVDALETIMLYLRVIFQHLAAVQICG